MMIYIYKEGCTPEIVTTRGTRYPKGGHTYTNKIFAWEHSTWLDMVLSYINEVHTRTTKTSQLATRDHHWDALRKETSITRYEMNIMPRCNLHKVECKRRKHE